MFSGLRRVSTVPLGSFAKASSLGAKTVKGPSPLRVSTKPAAVKAAARVLKLPLLTAVSTMSLEDSFENARFEAIAKIAKVVINNFFMNLRFWILTWMVATILNQ